MFSSVLSDGLSLYDVYLYAFRRLSNILLRSGFRSLKNFMKNLTSLSFISLAHVVVLV